jgi:hypothetical protein
VVWVPCTLGWGSRIQVVRRLPMGSCHLNHALAVVDRTAGPIVWCSAGGRVRTGTATSPATPRPGNDDHGAAAPHIEHRDEEIPGSNPDPDHCSALSQDISIVALARVTLSQLVL